MLINQLWLGTCFCSGGEKEGEAWNWRRRLWVWEELLEECRMLLFYVSLQSTSPDGWQWLPDPIGGGGVLNQLCLLLTHFSRAPACVFRHWFNLHKQVLFKVSIFAWWLLRDRLPTKANLTRHNIIASDERFCVAECGHVKDTQHLFLSCSTLGTLWPLVRSWINLKGQILRLFQITFISLFFTLVG